MATQLATWTGEATLGVKYAAGPVRHDPSEARSAAMAGVASVSAPMAERVRAIIV